MKTIANAEKGFTLIELLVALALVSIVAAGLISVYWIGASAYNRENLQADAQYDARVAMDKISSDIWECEVVKVQNYNGTEVAAGTPGLQLFMIKKEDGVGTDGKVYITYRMGEPNKILYRKRDVPSAPGEPPVVAPITINPVNIAFTDKGSGLIEITLKILADEKKIDDEENTLFQLSNRCQRRMMH